MYNYRNILQITEINFTRPKNYKLMRFFLFPVKLKKKKATERCRWTWIIFIFFSFWDIFQNKMLFTDWEKLHYHFNIKITKSWLFNNYKEATDLFLIIKKKSAPKSKFNDWPSFQMIYSKNNNISYKRQKKKSFIVWPWALPFFSSVFIL